MDKSQFKDIPVTVFLAVSLIIIFSLYTTTAIKSIPCGKNVLSVFYSNFFHAEPAHLMANLFGLYALSRVERDIGAKRFFSLVIFLLTFNTVIEVLIHRLFPSVPCSIGFSGVLFGITTWELVIKKEWDFFLIISIIATTIVPGRNISLIGHVVGAIAGIIGGFIWKNISA